MRPYSTREVAELLEMPVSTVRALAKAGFVSPQCTERGHYRFSFQDVVLLRTAKALTAAKLPPRRIWRALKSLAKQLPPDRPLSSVRVLVEGDRVLVRDNNTAWEPESGQTHLDFSVRELTEKVAPLVRASAARAAHEAATSSAQWFDIGLQLEQVGALADAESAYRRAVEIDPRQADALVNLGRLRHGVRALREAEQLYRQALAIEPEHSTARFNLGVVLEDRGAVDEAMENYKLAITADAEVADAHYNLARLYERRGDLQAALRHFSRFKALNRNP
jgi:tetratricopeptide (TPR) repeat protein